VRKIILVALLFLSGCSLSVENLTVDSILPLNEDSCEYYVQVSYTYWNISKELLIVDTIGAYDIGDKLRICKY